MPIGSNSSKNFNDIVQYQEHIKAQPTPSTSESIQFAGPSSVQSTAQQAQQLQSQLSTSLVTNPTATSSSWQQTMNNQEINPNHNALNFLQVNVVDDDNMDNVAENTGTYFLTGTGKDDIDIPNGNEISHIDKTLSLDVIIPKLKIINDHQIKTNVNVYDLNLNRYLNNKYYQNEGFVKAMTNDTYKVFYRFDLTKPIDTIIPQMHDILEVVEVLRIIKDNVPYMNETATFVHTILELYAVFERNFDTIEAILNNTEQVMLEKCNNLQNEDYFFKFNKITNMLAMAPKNTQYSEFVRNYYKIITNDNLD